MVNALQLIVFVVAAYTVIAMAFMVIRVVGERADSADRFCWEHGMSFRLEDIQSGYCYSNGTSSSGRAVCFNTTGLGCGCNTAIMILGFSCDCPPVNTTVGWC